MEQEYTKLRNEYGIALSLWSETRALYSSDQPEVIAATKYLEELEQELSFYNKPALAA